MTRPALIPAAGRVIGERNICISGTEQRINVILSRARAERPGGARLTQSHQREIYVLKFQGLIYECRASKSRGIAGAHRSDKFIPFPSRYRVSPTHYPPRLKFLCRATMGNAAGEGRDKKNPSLNLERRSGIRTILGRHLAP